MEWTFPTSGPFECTARRSCREAVSDHARLARGRPNDVDHRGHSAALVLASLQSRESLSARGGVDLGATSGPARARAADRAARPVTHAEREGRDPDRDGTLHRRHRPPARGAHAPRLHRLRDVLQ